MSPDNSPARRRQNRHPQGAGNNQVQNQPRFPIQPIPLRNLHANTFFERNYESLKVFFFLCLLNVIFYILYIKVKNPHLSWVEVLSRPLFAPVLESKQRDNYKFGPNE